MIQPQLSFPSIPVMISPPNSERKNFDESQQTSPWLVNLKQKMSDLLTKLDTRQIQTDLNSESEMSKRKSTKEQSSTAIKNWREQNGRLENNTGTFHNIKSRILTPLLIQLLTTKKNVQKIVENHPEVAVVCILALFNGKLLSVGYPVWTSLTAPREQKKEALIYCK
jgi:hypothetical protein